MSLQHAVLGVLEARPMSGYELTRFFESSARWVWTAPQSQIYPLLKRLEADGFIAGEQQVRGEKLRRTSYSLTDDGLANLQSWLSETHPGTSVRDPMLLQALFFDMVDPDAAERVLREHMADLASSIEQWTAHQARLLAHDTPLLRERLRRRDAADHDRVATLKAHVFDCLIESAQVRISWAERAIAIVHNDLELDETRPRER